VSRPPRDAHPVRTATPLLNSPRDSFRLRLFRSLEPARPTPRVKLAACPTCTFSGAPTGATTSAARATSNAGCSSTEREPVPPIRASDFPSCSCSLKSTNSSMKRTSARSRCRDGVAASGKHLSLVSMTGSQAHPAVGIDGSRGDKVSTRRWRSHSTSRRPSLALLLDRQKGLDTSLALLLDQHKVSTRRWRSHSTSRRPSLALLLDRQRSLALLLDQRAGAIRTSRCCEWPSWPRGAGPSRDPRCRAFRRGGRSRAEAPEP
jgi:hypothetical protein